MFSTAAAVVLVALCAMPIPTAAAEPNATLFRVFLNDGTSLVSFGEFARVADRVVLSVPIGEGTDPPLRIVSISEASVDWRRTDEYSAAVRAKRYAETRGEQDFVALAGQVTAALNDIALTDDPKRRVAMAREARRNLAAWPAANHNYRAAEVAQMVAMLDDVVAEMRIAAGETEFDLSLVATTVPPPLPELIPAPDMQGSLETAFEAALLASDPDERIAILRTIGEQLVAAPAASLWASSLRTKTASALAGELRVEMAYADLVKNSLRSAAERANRADVRGLQQIIARALSADDRLGRKRAGQMTGLLAALDVHLNEARRLRLARDAEATRMQDVWDYRIAMRPARKRIAGLREWLGHIRDLSGPHPGTLLKLDDQAASAQQELAAIKVPATLQSVHSLFVSSVHMVRQATSLRRTAIATNTLKLAWDASSAAAGALMLLQRAEEELKLASRPSQ